MKLSEIIRESGIGIAGMDIADEVAQLEAKLDTLQNTIDYIWQEIYEADEPVLSVASVEKLRSIGKLTAEQQFAQSLSKRTTPLSDEEKRNALTGGQDETE